MTDLVRRVLPVTTSWFAASLLLTTPASAQAPGDPDDGDAGAPYEPAGPSSVDTDQVVIVSSQAPVIVQGAPGQAPAAADMPPVPMTVPPAPYTDPWSNVSHINGQVVPVGERGKYLHTFKRTNVASNPIGWMFGFYGLSVSHAVTTNVVLRGDANLFALEDRTTGYELGASVPIYFKRAYHGPFIEPGIIVRHMGDDRSYSYYDDNVAGRKRTPATVGPEMLFGWHWTFDSGLNVAAAAGASRNMNQTRDRMYEYQSSEDTVELAGYFRVGYAF